MKADDDEIFRSAVIAAEEMRRALGLPEDTVIEVRFPGTRDLRETANRLRARLAAEHVAVTARGIR